MRKKSFQALALVGILAWAGCGGGTVQPDAAAPSDGGVDASIVVDAGHDASSVDAAPVDVGTDAGHDAGHDAFDCHASGTVDFDGDGFTGDDGDCDDCDAHVNPGAVDVFDGTAWGDQDCDGTAGDDIDDCDGALALDDTTAVSAVRALDLCRVIGPTARTWGVIDSRWTRASGVDFAPGTQVGLLSGFGPNNQVQSGMRMVGISSGHARTPSQAGACGSASCMANATGTPPAGFPWSMNRCGFGATIADDVALAVTMRVPTNAVGVAFDFRVFSFEYPAWVCSGASDAAVVLMNTATSGSDEIVRDGSGEPPNTLSSFFVACDPTTESMFASNCHSGGCPSPPTPYCPYGAGPLAGTGFDTWGTGASTYWLETTQPVEPGSTLTLRFLVYDNEDGSYDTTALFDHFRWITSGTAASTTTPIASPR